jgi:putative methylase
MEKISKSKLAITLSKLKLFCDAKINFEQYPTDSEIAADVIWKAFMNNEIKNKNINDLGSGTGILGIGCLLLGAKHVNFVEIDKDAIKILKENLTSLNINKKKYSIYNEDINSFNIKSDIIIQNPPFGSKNKHADKAFLQKAFELSNIIYSFHIKETKDFIFKFSEKNSFKVTHYWDYSFPLKKTMKQHTKKLLRIDVTAYRLEKNN